MLKNIDRKYLYILGLIIAIPAVILILLLILRGCSGSKSSGYSKYEEKMIDAADSYYKDKGYPEINGVSTVSIDELVKNSNLKSVEETFKNKNCSGSVTIRNNGGFYNYTPYLKCDDYKTTYIVDKLKEDIVTEKSGLYQVGNSYVYKGNKVNNYVSFFDKKYLVVSIDENNIMKLVKLDSESDYFIWDSKYNVDKKQMVGVNNYSDSVILDTLNDKYEKVKDNMKKHMIGYNVCVGNRDINNAGVNSDGECSKILENQYYSLLNSYDFANASYDPNCVEFDGPSCVNYNYIYELLNTTWFMNGNGENTYEVYFFNQGYIDITRANNSKRANLVIYLDGNELYSKGNGSSDNPYVIK